MMNMLWFDTLKLEVDDVAITHDFYATNKEGVLITHAVGYNNVLTFIESWSCINE